MVYRYVSVLLLFVWLVCFASQVVVAHCSGRLGDYIQFNWFYQRCFERLKDEKVRRVKR